MESTTRPRLRRLLMAAALALAILAVTAPALVSATARKLNGTLALGGRIEAVERFDAALNRPMFPGYQISPDNSAVVFLADQSTAGVFELYSVPLGGGTPAKLNGALAPGGNVTEFAIDSASSRVVYLADQRADESFELFSVPIGGGTPVTLNSFLTPEGDVSNFALSPDGSSVIFRADRNDDEVFDLFSVPIGGGSPDVRLNDRGSTLGDVQSDFAIAPDNQRVVFRYDLFELNTFELFSAPLTGGSPPSDLTDASVGLPAGRSVLDFVISPDSDSVASRVFSPAVGNSNLFLSPISGPISFFVGLTNLPALSSVEAPPLSDVPLADRLFPEELPYAFTPDAADLIFIADATDTLYQLHRVTASSTPGAPVLLSNLIDTIEDVTNFRISPDSERIVYRADDFDNSFELTTVARAGGPESFLLPVPPPPTGDIFEFAISPDSSRVIYRGDFNSDEIFELRSSPIDSSAGTVVINGPLAPGGDVERFSITANSQRVIYAADQDIDGVVELYSVLLTGGTPSRLNSTLVNGGDLQDFVVSPTTAGGRVIFRADTLTDEVFNLVSVPIAGGTSVILTDTESISGDVSFYRLTDDGAHAVFVADQDTDEVFELYSRPLGSGGPLQQLNDPLGPDGDVATVVLSPDSQRVVYIADQDTDEVQELYSVPVGGGSVVKLNPPLVAGGGVAQASVSPDGQRVVYLADQATPGVFDLYSVAIGGGPAVRLSSLVPGRSIAQFAVSPNSQRVVYIADQGSAGVFELFSIAIGGGSPSTLNGLLPAGGNVMAFELSPDSSRVAFVGDQNTNEVFELYSVPLGGGALTRLNPPLLPNRDVSSSFACFGQRSQWDSQAPGGGAPFLISPNSQRVIYCADQDSDEVLELYSAPLGGGAAPVKLNVPPGLGGGVQRFEISPDSNRVVFESFTFVAGSPQAQLYSAPLGGGSQPTLLNGPVRAFSFVPQFAVSLDSSTVLFTNDRENPGVVELYAVSSAGGPVSRRSGELVTGGNVTGFKISADSTRVVYTADQLSDEVQELFAALLSGDVAPVVISDPLVTGGDVQGFFDLRRSNDGVVYHADQEIDEVLELYETGLEVTPPEAVRVAFVNDVSLSESAGSAVLSVGLDRVATGPVTVSYSVTGGTASGGGVDYLLAPGSLTFAAGELAKTITVTIIDDGIDETDETVVVTLAAPTGAALGSSSSATLTIRDNDGPAGLGQTLYLPMLRR